jgi:malonate decarboxylase beta subunit
MKRSFYEANARQRIAGLVDAGSFNELLPPAERATSPHLPLLDTPVAFDDGVVVGEATLNGRAILIAAQEGGFMGGAVGEVHGAKLTGLFERAIVRARDGTKVAVLLLLESGGVRLHEANAGLIAVSETMRALLDARAAGVVVIGLIGSGVGCFGGMGLIAACCDSIVMSEEGRFGMSGPEVIETKHGVEEFDSRDRALVWRTTGGKHRYLLGDAAVLVDDDVVAFRNAALAVLDHARPLTAEGLFVEQASLTARIDRFGTSPDALDIWRALGVAEPEALPLLDRDAFVAATSNVRRGSFEGVARPLDFVADELAAATPLRVLLDALFPAGHAIGVRGDLVVGTAIVDKATICVVGTTNHAEIGVELALAMAAEVLRTVRDDPGRATRKGSDCDTATSCSASTSTWRISRSAWRWLGVRVIGSSAWSTAARSAAATSPAA